MDEWKVESPELEEVRQRLRRREKEEEAKTRLEAWAWAKRVVEAEAEVPCVAPRAEVWTRAEAKAREIADAIVRDAEKRPWGARGMKVKEGPWGTRWYGGNSMILMAQAQIDALALVGVLGWVRSEARARGERVPSVLADSSTVGSILSILERKLLGAVPHLWHHSPETRDEYSSIIHFITPINRLPFELLRQIFLIIIDGASAVPLLLVCKQWNAVVTSIWAPLYLTTMTPLDVVMRKLERNPWLLDIRVVIDSDRGPFNEWTPSGAFGAIFAAMEARSRWRSLVVESFLAQADLSEGVVNRGLQLCSDNTMSRFTVFKIKSACETSPLLNGLLHILGTTARALITVEINSANVISFLAPAYPSMFHSIKVLSLDTPRIPNPVDVLPHLHQLETFTASHISFPVYHSDIELPFIHTLRYLSLRAASIQWMSGRTFHVLEHFTLIFPLHHRVLNTFRATLPNCTNLTFQGYPLDILGGVLAHKLAHLSVGSSASFNRCGSQQLVWLSHQVLGQARLTPKILHIRVEATNQAWVNALHFMSNLEELVISNARPSSLRAKALQSLIIQPVHAIIPGAAFIPGGSEEPLCPVLQRFGLKYDRWLRPSEEFDLTSVFESIIQSRQNSNCSLKSFSIWIPGSHISPLKLIERSQLSVTHFYYLGGWSRPRPTHPPPPNGRRVTTSGLPVGGRVAGTASPRGLRRVNPTPSRF